MLIINSRYYFGNRPVLTIAEPELIKAIIVKDFHLFPDRSPNRSTHPITSKNLLAVTGDDWKRIRTIITPTFTSGKMKKMYPLIRECLNDFMSHLEPLAKERKDINAKDMFGNYTMDVIATCAFGTKTDIHNELDSPFVANARKAFSPNILKLIMFLTLPVSLLKTLKIGQGSSEARDFFLNTLRQILEKRRNRTDTKSYDFVQLLIDAGKGSAESMRDENDDIESHHINEGIVDDRNQLGI